jgi:hypothetical protein
MAVKPKSQSVPKWMDPVLKVKKKRKTKSAIRKKVDRVYKDHIIPNRDEREPEPVELVKDPDVEIAVLDTEEHPAGDFTERADPQPTASKGTVPHDVVKELMRDMFSFNKQWEQWQNLPDDKPDRPALRRPPVNDTPFGILQGLQSAIKQAISLALINDDVDAVCKYAQWLQEVSQSLTKYTPIVKCGDRKPVKPRKPLLPNKVKSEIDQLIVEGTKSSLIDSQPYEILDMLRTSTEQPK